MAARFKLFELFGSLGLDTSQFKTELRQAPLAAAAAGQQIRSTLATGTAAAAQQSVANLSAVRQSLALIATQAGLSGQAVRALFAGAAVGGGAAILGGAAGAIVGFKQIIGSIQEMDEALKHIRGSTGETGAVLENVLLQTLNDVPATVRDASDAIASLAQRTGATGLVLQDLTDQELNLARITGTDVRQQILLTTKAFQDWGIATERQAAFMDYLLKIWQRTGTPLTTILSQLDRFGEPLKTAGFSAEQAAAMIAKFDKEGVNVTTTLSGLRWGSVALARTTQDLVGGFQETIDAIRSARTEQEALTIAASVFKTKAAVDIMRAAREGRMDILGLMKAVQESTETIQKAATETEGLSQAWQRLKNSASIAADAFTPILSASARLLTIWTQLQNLQTQGFALGVRGAWGLLTGQPPVITPPEPRSRVSLTMPPEAWQRTGEKFGPTLEQQIAQLQADAGLGAHTEAQIRDEIAALQDLIEKLRQAGGHTYDLAKATQQLAKLQDELGGFTRKASLNLSSHSAALQFLNGIIDAQAKKQLDLRLENEMAVMMTGRLNDITGSLTYEMARMSLGATRAAAASSIQADSERELAFRLDEVGAASRRKTDQDARLDAALRNLASAAGNTRFELADLKRTFEQAKEAAHGMTNEQELLNRAQADYDAGVRRIIDRSATHVRALRQVSTILTDLGRGFAEILLPRGGGGRDPEEEKRRNILAILKQAADEFAQKGYSEPIRALGNFIDRIKAASTDAEANAIAMRVLGRANQELVATIRHGGPAFEQMLQELRQGYPLLDRLSASTEQATGRLSRMKQMIEEVGRSIIRMGIEGLINSRQLSDAFRKLGDVLLSNLDILGRMLRHIPLIGRALDDYIFGPRAVAGATGSIARGAGGAGAGAAGTIISEGGEVPGILGGGGGPTAAAGSGLAGVIGAAGAVAGAVSSIIGNFQMHGMNKSLDLIVLHTLQTANDLSNLRADAWMREDHLMRKLDDMWNEIRNVVRVASGLPVASAAASVATPAISQTNNFYGLSGQQAAQTVLDDIVRLLEARGLRAPA